MNPWLTAELVSARTADVERAAQKVRLRAEARATAHAGAPAGALPHALGPDHPAAVRTPLRRAVTRRVGEQLIAVGARLAGPEATARRLHRV